MEGPVPLLAALRGDCRLVLVGDPDQLPSVGPGSLFSDLIRSGAVPMVRLTEGLKQLHNGFCGPLGVFAAEKEEITLVVFQLREPAPVDLVGISDDGALRMWQDKSGLGSGMGVFNGDIGVIQEGDNRGETVTVEEFESFKTDLLLFCARQYARMGWAMQIHYNLVSLNHQPEPCWILPGTSGQVWQPEEIAEVMDQLHQYGFNGDVVESVNVHDDIKIGLPTRDS